MGLQSDYTCGLAKESIYGQVATPGRWWEANAKLAEKVTTANGKGFRASQRAVRGTRNTVAKRESSGSIVMTAMSSGLGMLLQALFGTTPTATLLSTGAYQYLFTPTTSDYLPSYTVQQGIPILGKTTTEAFTFVGAQCSGVDVSAKAGEGVDLTSQWIARQLLRTVAAGTPSFPATMEQFTFTGASMSIGGGSLGGTFVAATANTPASIDWSDGTPFAPDCRELSLSFKNSLDSNGWNLGGGGLRARPAALKGGAADLLTGSTTYELTDVRLVDAARNREDLSVVVNLLGQQSINGTVYKPMLQFAAPLVRFDVETPAGNDGDVITSKASFTAYAPSTSDPVVSCVYRTPDAAL